MSIDARPRPVCMRVRLAHAVVRLLSFALRIVIVGLAMGVAPPSLVVKFVRHEDPIAQVAEEDDELR